MSEVSGPHTVGPAPQPQWGLLVTARPAGWHALGISAATAVAVFTAVPALATPVLYAVCAIRLRRVSL